MLSTPATRLPAPGPSVRPLHSNPIPGRSNHSRRRARRAAGLLTTALLVLFGAALWLGTPVSGEPSQVPPSPVVPPECTPLPSCLLTLSSEPASQPVVPLPAPPTTGCDAGDLPAGCPTSVPCQGEGCLPQPSPSAPSEPTPSTAPPSESSGRAECGLGDVGGCITNAIDDFFRNLAQDAVNPLLDLLSTTLLSTPTPESLPRIGQLWQASWQIQLVCYSTLVLVAGVLVMSYETLQTRHAIKEFAPRLIIGFLAGALSLWVASKAIQIANALAEAIVGDELAADAAGRALRNLVASSVGGPIWMALVTLVLAGMLVVLLATYLVRVAITIILIAGAPLALMCHATPQTEGIAFWWWKAFGGCLGTQIAQSVALITTTELLLDPAGFTIAGPNAIGMVNLLVALALVYILLRIPFWVFGSLRGGRRSMLSTIIRGFVAYKTLGLLTGRGPRPRTPPPAHGPARPDPTAAGGAAAATSAIAVGSQLPSHRPVRRPRSATGTRPAPGRTSSAGVPGPEAARRSDPYRGIRPNRDGQYALPLHGLQRQPRRSQPPATEAWLPVRRRRPRQPELPFDPYQGIRPNRAGQYALPLQGLQRLRPVPPTPTPVLPTPRRPRPVRQPRLPFDPPTTAGGSA